MLGLSNVIEIYISFSNIAESLTIAFGIFFIALHGPYVPFNLPL